MYEDNGIEKQKSQHTIELENIFNPLFKSLAEDSDPNKINNTYTKMYEEILKNYRPYMIKNFGYFNTEQLVSDTLLVIYEDFKNCKIKNRDYPYFTQLRMVQYIQRAVYKDLAEKSETNASALYDCSRVRNTCVNYNISISKENAVKISRLSNIPIARVVSCLHHIDYMDNRVFNAFDDDDCKSDFHIVGQEDDYELQDEYWEDDGNWEDDIG